MSKLEWVQLGCSPDQTATITPTLRIRAAHDPEGVGDPFKDDGHWPMIVRQPDRFSKLDVKVNCTGHSPDVPLRRFSDHALVHDQHAIAKLLGFISPHGMVDEMDTAEARDPGTEEPIKYFRDGGVLRDAAADALENLNESDRMTAYAALYELLGIPYLHTNATGYSQGDWADLLIVATPEKVAEFRPSATPDEIKADLAGQAELYRAWAYGDTYGYVIETCDPAHADDDEDDELDWIEIEDGSCWGYYGTDHAASGLEEAAMEIVNHHLAQQERKAA